MRVTVTIKARCFNGLTVEVDATVDEIKGARFASSGKALPASMYSKLVSSADDIEAIFDEVGREYYDAGKAQQYRDAMREYR